MFANLERVAQLRVERGDITRASADAIVNAANETLLGGGGVDGAIHRAAGPALLDACLALPEVRRGVRCPTGEARVTPGFALPARLVIHTVGPVWRGGEHGERELLAACYRNVLALCVEHGVHTVAIPAISCGVYRFPAQEAASIAVREIRRAIASATPLDSVKLIAFDANIYAALTSAIES